MPGDAARIDLPLRVEPGHHPETEPFAGVLALAVATALAVVVPVYLTGSSTPTPLPDEWCIVTLVLAGLRLAWMVGRGQPWLYSASAWIFIYVFLGLAPLVQMRTGVLPDTTPVVEYSTYGTCVAAVLVGAVAMEIASLIRSSRPIALNRATRVVSKNRTVLMVIFTFLFTAYNVQKTGLAPYFQSREALTIARANAYPNSTVAALVNGAGLAFPLVTFHALVLMRRERRTRGRIPSLFITTVAMGAMLIILDNFFSSARIFFGTVLLSLAVMAGAIKTRRRTRATIVALLVGLVFVFPASDIFRFTDTAGAQGKDGGLQALARSGDYDAFPQISNAVSLVNDQGATNGQQMLGVLFFWVPRSIWPDKPIDTGVLTASHAGYNFTNLSSPLWAEGYINGGMLGVPLLLGLFGYFIRAGDLHLASDLRRGGAAAVAGAILPFYLLIVLRGSLLQAMGALAALLFAIWFVSEKPFRMVPEKWRAT